MNCGTKRADGEGQVSRRRSFDSGGQVFFDQLANCVEKQLVSFLNARGHLVPDEQFDIGNAGTFAAVATEHGDGGETHFFCGNQRPVDVFAFAAGGEDHEDIAAQAEGFDLPAEKVFEAIVISNRRQIAAMSGEADGRIGTSVLDVAAYKFGRKM
jgi:hypothetical protein